MKKVDGGSNVPLLSPFFFSFFFNKMWSHFCFIWKEKSLPSAKNSQIVLRTGHIWNFPVSQTEVLSAMLNPGFVYLIWKSFSCMGDKKKSYPETHFCTSRGQTTGWLSTRESRECVLAKSPALLWLLSQATNHKWKRKEKKRDILDSRKKKISFCFQASVNYDISKTCSLHCFL